MNYLAAVIFFMGMIALGVLIISYKRSGKKKKIILAIMAILGIYCLIESAMTGTETKEQEIISYELIALKDTSKEDSQYKNKIFSMRIDKQEIPAYRFYYKKANGDIVFCEQSVKDMMLVHTKGTPCYEITTSYQKILDKRFLGFFRYTVIGEKLETEYRLHIPEESLITDIEIDMQ